MALAAHRTVVLHVLARRPRGFRPLRLGRAHPSNLLPEQNIPLLQNTQLTRNTENKKSKEISAIIRALKMRNSRIFLTAKFFYPDCRVGRIRPPGKC